MENTAEQVDGTNTVEQVDGFGVTKDEQAAYNRKKFVEELGALINTFSLENKSNTPDFILAEFMLHCLTAFEATSLRREAWFGVSLDVARGWENKVMQAMGEASMCWSNIEGAGVFDSTKAKQVGDDLLKYLRNGEQLAPATNI